MQTLMLIVYSSFAIRYIHVKIQIQQLLRYMRVTRMAVTWTITLREVDDNIFGEYDCNDKQPAAETESDSNSVIAASGWMIPNVLYATCY